MPHGSLPRDKHPMRRCDWPGDDPLMIAYHDREWGEPVSDDRLLFEAFVLGGAQAGLNWRIILHRREGYRAAFAGFDPARVAGFDARKVASLLKNPAIIRNRLKIKSAIINARAVLAVQREFGGFHAYLARFAPAPGAVPAPRAPGARPTRSAESDALSADLKARGFKFVGTTICYAVMQSVGMVNDHLAHCFRRMPIERKLRRGIRRR